jgi:hypothetical protein
MAEQFKNGGKQFVVCGALQIDSQTVWSVIIHGHDGGFVGITAQNPTKPLERLFLAGERTHQYYFVRQYYFNDNHISSLKQYTIVVKKISVQDS